MTIWSSLQSKLPYGKVTQKDKPMSGGGTVIQTDDYTQKYYSRLVTINNVDAEIDELYSHNIIDLDYTIYQYRETKNDYGFVYNAIPGNDISGLCNSKERTTESEDPFLGGKRYRLYTTSDIVTPYGVVKYEYKEEVTLSSMVGNPSPVYPAWPPIQSHLYRFQFSGYFSKYTLALFVMGIDQCTEGMLEMYKRAGCFVGGETAILNKASSSISSDAELQNALVFGSKFDLVTLT